MRRRVSGHRFLGNGSSFSDEPWPAACGRAFIGIQERFRGDETPETEAMKCAFKASFFCSGVRDPESGGSGAPGGF